MSDIFENSTDDPAWQEKGGEARGHTDCIGGREEKCVVKLCCRLSESGESGMSVHRRVRWLENL